MTGELRTIFMESLKTLEADHRSFRETIRQSLASLDQRLTQSEKHLTHLAELYKDLERLIAAIENDLESGP